MEGSSFSVYNTVWPWRGKLTNHNNFSYCQFCLESCCPFSDLVVFGVAAPLAAAIRVNSNKLSVLKIASFFACFCCLRSELTRKVHTSKSLLLLSLSLPFARTFTYCCCWTAKLNSKPSFSEREILTLRQMVRKLWRCQASFVSVSPPVLTATVATNTRATTLTDYC